MSVADENVEVVDVQHAPNQADLKQAMYENRISSRQQYPVIVSLVVHKHGAIEVDAVKERLAHPDGDSAVPAYTGSVTLLAGLRLTLENILPIVSHLPQRLRLCT